MTELPLDAQTILLTYSDGLATAGKRYGKGLPWESIDQQLVELPVSQLGGWVDELIAHAIDLDQGRPSDDISVMALGVVMDESSALRKLTASIPY